VLKLQVVLERRKFGIKTGRIKLDYKIAKDIVPGLEGGELLQSRLKLTPFPVIANDKLLAPRRQALLAL
jgi:hypothetical protein